MQILVHQAADREVFGEGKRPPVQGSALNDWETIVEISIIIGCMHPCDGIIGHGVELVNERGLFHVGGFHQSGVIAELCGG